MLNVSAITLFGPLGYKTGLGFSYNFFGTTELNQRFLSLY